MPAKGKATPKPPAKPPQRNEQTSAEIARIASRGLRGEKLTPAEVRRVSGAALTQTTDKPKK